MRHLRSVREYPIDQANAALAAGLMCFAGIGVVISATGNPYIGILGLCIKKTDLFLLSPFLYLSSSFFSGSSADAMVSDQTKEAYFRIHPGHFIGPYFTKATTFK